MSATLKNHKSPTIGRMCDVMQSIGKLAIIRDKTSDYQGHIVLRVYDQIISLSNPRCTWSNIDSVGILVEVLPAGTIVEYGSEI